MAVYPAQNAMLSYNYLGIIPYSAKREDYALFVQLDYLQLTQS